MQYRVQKNGSCMLLSFAKLLSYHFGHYGSAYDLLIAAKDILSFVGRDISEEGLSVQEVIDFLTTIGGSLTQYEDITVTTKSGVQVLIPLRPLEERVNFQCGYWVAGVQLPSGGFHVIPIIQGHRLGISFALNNQIVESFLPPFKSNEWKLHFAWRLDFNEGYAGHRLAHEQCDAQEVHQRLSLVELTFEDFVGTGLAGREIIARGRAPLAPSVPDLTGSDASLGSKTY